MSKTRRLRTSPYSLEHAGWNVSIAKVRGTGHSTRNVPCQDDVRCRIVQSSVVIAVSDGADSARFSDHGSAVAVRSAAYHMQRRLESGRAPSRKSLVSTLTNVIDDLCSLRRTLGEAGIACTPQDFACTLVLTVLSPRSLHMVQVGGGAVVLRSAGALHCLSTASTIAFVREGSFLTSPDPLAVAHTAEVDAGDLQALAVMTESVRHLGIKHDSNEPVGGFFNPLFDYVLTHEAFSVAQRSGELKAVLNSAYVNAQTADDKTLVLVAPRGARTGVSPGIIGQPNMRQ